MNPVTFNTIYVEKDVLQYPWVQECLNLCKASVIEIQSIAEEIDRSFVLPYPQDPIGAKSLFIGKQRGIFIRPCPCSLETKRCGYHYLSLGIGCPLECTYCFLQGFLNTSSPILYVNFPDMEKELKEWNQKMQNMGKILRLGTGEMTDSLIFDPISHFTRKLIDIFSPFDHLHLELKTKSMCIENILDKASPNVFIAWSLNPASIIEQEERKATTLQERLMAAKKSVQAGFSVAFHFDPIIPIDGWEDLYKETVEQLFTTIPASSIAWISLGIFRIFPGLRDTIRQRHPYSQVLLGEILPSFDGKLRYFKKIRVDVYKKMKQWIQNYSNVPLYLCMESEEMWKEIFPEHAPNWFDIHQCYFIES
ncbi:MAG: hypothetical protein KBC30_06710 [Planctomycetes bacterium]|nr:hypothetical protein [Planctomycetota bacterium]